MNFYTEKDELEEETIEIKYTDLYGQGEINISVGLRKDKEINNLHIDKIDKMGLS